MPVPFAGRYELLAVAPLPPEPEDATIARRGQELFRGVAGAAGWLDAAEQLGSAHPQIAEVLRVHGASRTATAEEHWRATLSG